MLPFTVFVADCRQFQCFHGTLAYCVHTSLVQRFLTNMYHAFVCWFQWFFSYCMRHYRTRVYFTLAKGSHMWAFKQWVVLIRWSKLKSQCWLLESAERVKILQRFQREKRKGRDCNKLWIRAAEIDCNETKIERQIPNVRYLWVAIILFFFPNKFWLFLLNLKFENLYFS